MVQLIDGVLFWMCSNMIKLITVDITTIKYGIYYKKNRKIVVSKQKKLAEVPKNNEFTYFFHCMDSGYY